FHFDLTNSGFNPYENVLTISNVSGLQTAWRFLTGRLVSSSAAVAAGIVYVGSWDHNLYALDASTGVKLWKLTTGNRIDSSPAVANGVVYVGSDDHSLYAIDASTGAKLWSFRTGGEVNSSPA